jgi:hypothetical protein
MAVTLKSMKHIVGTGTDIASVLIFDPSALPSDYDQRPKQQLEIIRKMHQDQRLFYVQTGADGACLIHAFVDEVMPDYLRPFIHEPYVHEHFEVPSGRGIAAEGNAKRIQAAPEHGILCHAGLPIDSWLRHRVLQTHHCGMDCICASVGANLHCTSVYRFQTPFISEHG